MRRAGLQAGHLAVQQAAGEVRDRQPLVPDRTQFAARQGSTALVHAAAAGGLTGRDCAVNDRYAYDEQGRCVAGAGPAGAASGRFAYGERVTWSTDAAGGVSTPERFVHASDP